MKKEKRNVIAIFGIIFVVWFLASLLLGYFVCGFDGILTFIIFGTLLVVVTFVVMTIMDILFGK